MKKGSIKRLTALLLALVMTASCGVSASAHSAQEYTPEQATFEKVEGISANLLRGQAVEKPDESPLYGDDDIVRVIITLEEPAVVDELRLEEADTADLAANPAAVDYHAQLLEEQADLASVISRVALQGEELDVVWNLTWLTNAMSANVPYGKLHDIAAVDGVASVRMSMRYDPMTSVPSNAAAKTMTGVTAVQNNEDFGYTGAGMRIAVLDTGTDTDHQSFDGASFVYSLGKDAEAVDMTYAEYVKGLDLLDEEELTAVLPLLHATEYYAKTGELTAQDLYLSEKLPFNFNYVDANLDVTHDNDTAGEHGSHVAGIAAANRYIPAHDLDWDLNGDGKANQADAQALMEYIINRTAYANADAQPDVDGDGKVTTHDVTVLLEGKSQDAVKSVGTEGVAPDAQIITMKVFGAAGGAFDDDICACLEDALVLGCDVANLSLGGAWAGFSDFYGYPVVVESDENNDVVANAIFMEKVMEQLDDTDMVVAIAAGNAGNWADNDVAYQLMYTDEAGTTVTSNPGTYRNPLTVASADNIGDINNIKNEFTNAAGDKSATAKPVDGNVSEGDYPAPVWNSMATDEGHTFDVVFLGDPAGLLGDGETIDDKIYGGTEADYAGLDVTGKVVMVSRGGYIDANGNGVQDATDEEAGITFALKHTNAGKAGAAAVLIYNNAPGNVGPTLDGTEATIPCAAITLDEAKAIYAAADKNNGVVTAKLTITSGLTVNMGDPENDKVVMSDFSSWGSTGALAIKPEITAPGGNIYSVNGADPSGEGYEQMSGTSMATPHISGMSALAMEYIAEKGLTAKTKLTRRVLAQSLLMSTAEPIVEHTVNGVDVEYSIRNQGSGLANLENVVNSESYILVDGQPDGKVKAELGDDPAHKGWSFSFTVNNLTSAAQTYDLDASILTTGTKEETNKYDATKTVFLATDEMAPLDAKVSYAGNGVSGTALTVPANGSAKVTVSISIPESAVNAMKAKGYTNGFYVEGFVYLNAAGATKVTHSIPLLGWYGNWTDPSMFDKGTYEDYFHRFYNAATDGSTVEVDMHWPDQLAHLDYTTANALESSYLWMENMFSIAPVGVDQGYYFSGNPYNEFLNCEDEYIAERNAINSTKDRMWQFYAIFPSLIRNATALRIQAYDPDTGEVYREDGWDDAGFIGTFFNQGEPVDMTQYYGFGFGKDQPWNYTDSKGNPLAEGRKITFELTILPELYRSIDEDGDAVYDWDAAGKGAKMSMTFTVDNTAPEMVEAKMVDADHLRYTVKDNRYVASVVLLDGAGTAPIKYYFPNQTKMNTATSGEIDLTGIPDKKITLAVCDYAGNETYYTVNRNGNGQPYGHFLGFQQDVMEGYYHNWAAFDLGTDKNETTVFSSAGADFAAAEYVNGWLFAQAADGTLYAIAADDFTSDKRAPEMIRLAKLHTIYQDLAYNYRDGRLYGMYNYNDKVYFNAIYLEEGESPEFEGGTVPAFDELDVGLTYEGIIGFAMAIDDNGSIYLMADEYPETTKEETATGDKADKTQPSIDANFLSLWKADMTGSTSSFEGIYHPLKKVAEPKISSNYRQSMAFDHTTEKLYWATFDRVRLLREDAYLYEIALPGQTASTPMEPAEATIRNPMQKTVGDYTFTCVASLGSETYGLMVPGATANAAHSNVPAFDRTEVGTPVLSDMNLTLVPGTTHQLSYELDPWYTASRDVTWTSSNEAVCTVSSSGLVTAVGSGAATVTATSKKDATKVGVCSVTVANAKVHMDGIHSSSVLYNFDVDGDQVELTRAGRLDYRKIDGDFGRSIMSSVSARGYIYGGDCDSTGVFYKMTEDGEVLDWFQPIDGDFMYALAYSEDIDLFTGAMGSYLYVDIPFSDDHAYEEDMKAQVGEPVLQPDGSMARELTWHRLDVADWLEQSNTDGFVTGEVGYGSRTDIVFAAMTAKDGEGAQTLTADFLGEDASARYTPDTTWVLLDNVGRFWKVDEVRGMKLANGLYTKSNMSIPEDMTGVKAITEDGVSSVFVVRSIEKSPLYDMYLAETLPKITYHYNDMLHTSKSATLTNADGSKSTVQRDIYFLSLNQSWWTSYLDNETDMNNYFYMYIPGVELADGSRTADQLLPLGQTDGGYPATINHGELISGVELDVDLSEARVQEAHISMDTLSDVFRRA